MQVLSEDGRAPSTVEVSAKNRRTTKPPRTFNLDLESRREEYENTVTLKTEDGEIVEVQFQKHDKVLDKVKQALNISPEKYVKVLCGDDICIQEGTFLKIGEAGATLNVKYYYELN